MNTKVPVIYEILNTLSKYNKYSSSLSANCNKYNNEYVGYVIDYKDNIRLQVSSNVESNHIKIISGSICTPITKISSCLSRILKVSVLNYPPETPDYIIDISLRQYCDSTFCHRMENTSNEMYTEYILRNAIKSLVTSGNYNILPKDLFQSITDGVKISYNKIAINKFKNVLQIVKNICPNIGLNKLETMIKYRSIIGDKESIVAKYNSSNHFELTSKYINSNVDKVLLKYSIKRCNDKILVHTITYLTKTPVGTKVHVYCDNYLLRSTKEMILDDVYNLTIDKNQSVDDSLKNSSFIFNNLYDIKVDDTFIRIMKNYG